MTESASGILTASRSWSSTPDNYASMRYLQFQSEGTGVAVYGYGQTIYAKIEFEFDVSSEDDSLTLKYLESSPFQRFAGFTPDENSDQKTISFALDSGNFTFHEDVTGFQFRFESKLSLSDSPFPVGLPLPHPVPTEYFGFRQKVEN